jgi:transcription elongation factor Elf1
MAKAQTPKLRQKQPESQSCANCQHVSIVTVLVDGKDEKRSFCRRYPPSLRVDGGSSYVPVKLDWLCGEYHS